MTAPEEVPATPDRPRVLLIVDQCNPDGKSVPLVGWLYYNALRKYANVHLVTQALRVRELEGRGLVEGDDFTAIDAERIVRPLWRVRSALRGGRGKGWTVVTAFSALSHYYFEHLLWKRFRTDLASGRFDLVHRLTPQSPTVPSRLVSQCRRHNIPIILGPLNGGLPWPAEFRDLRSEEREWLSGLRRLSRLLPYWRSTFRGATAVISGSRDTWNQLQAVVGSRHIYMPRNGVEVNRFQFTARPGAEDPTRPLKLLFVGRIVPLKCCDIIIEAAAELLNSGAAELTFVGSGRQKPQLEAMVSRESFRGVTFVGDVSHGEVHRYFAESDVFVFPSIKDFGGAVVLEAMASGLPVVVVDYGGPGELASSDCGILIPLGQRHEVRDRLRCCLEEICADRSKLGRWGRAARERAEAYFDWDAKAQQLLAIYEGVVNSPEVESVVPFGPR